jgi:hypothetical protein
MAKKLDSQSCENLLNEYHQNHFGWMIDSQVEWFPNPNDSNTYGWKFRYVGITYELICNKSTGRITRKETK